MVKSFKTNILTWLKTKTYIKTEIDSKLNNKANTNHNHDNKYSLLAHQHTGLDGEADAISNSAGQQSVARYRKVFRLKITKQYFDSPVTFEFVQRKCRQTGRVHIIFNSVTSIDPSLRNFTYEGAIEQPIYLHKESASTWVFITTEQSTYDTVNIRFLPLSSSIKNSCTITPLNEYLANLPTDNIQVGSMISATSTKTGYMDKMDKIKLNGIDDGANKTVVDSSLSSSSTNPVQNKVVNSALSGKANSSHSHSISNITNLQSALDSKSETGHTHDDRYYTETEMNTKLNGKANSSHTHSIGDVTNLQSKLNTIPTLTTSTITVSGANNAGTITFYKFGKIVVMELNLSKVHLTSTWNVVGTVPNGYMPKLADGAGSSMVFWSVQGQQGQSAQLNIKPTGEIRFAYGNGDTPPLGTYVTYIVD